jgi:hypothetical protein
MMIMNQTIGQVFLQSAIKRLQNYKELGEKTFGQLEEKDFHFQPQEASNSIAVIIQHMAGNMLSRWTHFLADDGEKDWRDRDGEFEVHGHDRTALMALWARGWNCLLEELASLTEEDLLKTIHIRSEPLSAMDAINRQLAHYSYHVGQIVYLGRLIRDADWQSLSIPKGKSGVFNRQLGHGKG